MQKGALEVGMRVRTKRSGRVGTVERFSWITGDAQIRWKDNDKLSWRYADNLEKVVDVTLPEGLVMTEGVNIFVFGSNLSGRHGKGAAFAALREHGAVYGQGVGLQGRSYAIPTKDERLRTLPLGVIAGHVRVFLDFAAAHPEMAFNVTRVGCGLAGYRDGDIAPMFAGAPDNCRLPEGWRRL